MKIAFYPGPLAVNNPYIEIISKALVHLGQTVNAYRPIDPFQSPDVLHLHWPEGLYMGKFARRSGALTDLIYNNLLATADRVKRKGGKIVWTAHNVRPHEPPPAANRRAWERAWPQILARLDTIICMSEYSASLIRHDYQDLRAEVVVIPHPHYGETYKSQSGRQHVRSQLGVAQDQYLIAAIGLIRPYKKIPQLITQFLLDRHPNERLLIAGKCHDPELIRAIEAARSGDSSVIVINKALTAEELGDLYGAADAAITNGEGVLNSGTVLTALSVGKPVIAPRSGALPEIQARVGENWCVLFDPPLVSGRLRQGVDATGSATGRPDMSYFDPQKVGRMHLDAYQA